MIKKLFFFAAFIFLCQSCHVGRFFIYNFADINDYKKFPSKELKKSDQPFYFIESNADRSKLKLPVQMAWKKKTYSFPEAIRSSGTVAFLVIRNDSVLYQWYDSKYNPSSIVPSFSMAKSYVSALVGIAISEGFIKSTSEPITNYLDYLDKSKFGNITIQHLLDMRSGIRYNESYYNPFGDVAKYYYGTNIKKYVKHLKVKTEPGKEFEYVSLNSQLLGLIIEKATGRGLTQYLSDKIWTQIGTEFDASWSIDSKKHGTEKAFCCINARTKDFAKFGRLYLNKGSWQGRQIIPAEWVNESVNFQTNKNNFLYSNQWWHSFNYYSAGDSAKIKEPYVLVNATENNKPVQYLMQPSGDFFALGHLGQFIYISPENNVIIVRLGKKEGWIDWENLLVEICGKN